MGDAGPVVRGGRVGVRDVARRAGVSAQTVSRVINDDPRVRETTRSRVREAIDALDYRINNAARSLGTNQTRTLGVVVSDALLFGPSAGVSALEAAARAADRWIATAYADASDPASVDDAVRHLVAQGVDGIVLVAQNLDTIRRLSSFVGSPSFPVVALHHGVGGAAQRAGAGLTVAHLAALGHRRIARLGGPRGWVEEEARQIGFDAAVVEHRLQVTHRFSGDWSSASGARWGSAVVAALRQPAPPTALVVANDQMALGLMAVLAEAGYAIPGDVSVIGFDDNPDAGCYRPALTTVRVDVGQEARRCVASVLGDLVAQAERQVDSGGAAEPPVPELVIRASTGRPPHT